MLKPEGENLSRRFLRNASWRVVTALWIKLLGLFAVPVIIYSIGPNEHGVYVLLLGITTNFKFIDLGFGAGLVKYFAQHRAMGDEETVRGIVRTTMGMNLLAGLIGFAAIWWCSNGFLLKYFKNTPEIAPQVPLLLKLMAVTFFVQMISGAPASTLQAVHRFDVHSMIEIVSKGVEIGGYIVILLLKGNLTHLIEYYLLLSGAIAVAFLACAWKFVPGVSFFPKISPNSFKLLLGFGVFITISRIAAALSSYFDKFILLAFISAAYVSYYFAPFQLAMLVSFIPMMVAPIIMPTASELHARGDTERLKQLFIRGTKYIFVLSMPIVLFLLLAPAQTIRFWISAEYADKGAKVLAALALSQAILLLTFFVPNMIVVGMGKVRAGTIYNVAAGVLNLALCRLLIPRYGIMGAAWALLVSTALTAPAFMLYFLTHVRLKLSDFLKEKYPQAVAANVALCACLYLARGFMTGRATLVAGLLLTGVLTLAFVWVFNVPTKNEKEIILGYVAKLKGLKVQRFKGSKV